MLPPLRSIPIKDRNSLLYLAKGQIDVKDGAFVLIDKKGVRTHVPIGGLACLLLEPGTRLSHSAAKLAAQVGCLLVWTGESGVRLYSAGQPGGARSDRLLYQAELALDPKARLKVVQRMFAIRFQEDAPQRRSVDQLRGIEGARVRKSYGELAETYGVDWKGRRYNPGRWNDADLPNRALSAATACLYGIAEAAILAAGYAPAIGFLHTGKPLSFVYDIADLFKMDTVVPVAFEVAGEGREHGVEGKVRRKCRDMFRRERVLSRIIPTIHDVLAAGEKTPPEAPEWAVQPAIPKEESQSDGGHRN